MMSRDGVQALWDARENTKEELKKAAEKFDKWVVEPEREYGNEFIHDLKLDSRDTKAVDTIVEAFKKEKWVATINQHTQTFVDGSTHRMTIKFDLVKKTAPQTPPAASPATVQKPTPPPIPAPSQTTTSSSPTPAPSKPPATTPAPLTPAQAAR